MIVLSLVAVPASAQSALPAGLDHPDRAMALRPTGMALHRSEWSTLMFNGSAGSFDVAHYVSQEWEGRVPIDSLLLEVAAGAWFVWRPGSDQVVVLNTNNVQIGAAFRDAPAPGWRYEIGGALTLPTMASALMDPEDPPPPGGVTSPFPMLPIRNLFASRGSGWNLHRARRDTVAVVPHVRVEVDPIPEMVLGLEVDLPILVFFQSDGVGLSPQIALEVAARFEETSLVGLRAELTSAPDLSVLLEPFVRVVFARHVADAFVRLGLRLPLGPAYPFATASPLGYVGGTLEAGTLF